MVSQQFNTWYQVNREKFNDIARTAKKINLAQLDLDFLQKCSSHRVLPNFTRLKKYTIKQGRLSPKQIVSTRFKILEDEIVSKSNLITSFKSKFEAELKSISDKTSHRLYKKILYNINFNAELKLEPKKVKLEKKSN